ncbi:MAG TPA: DUF2339 domain-containing protein [Acidobacteriaceae bacterium]|nr:DUF2339 domain-containing protein [Acidobacteriaceae bacterium]
MARMVARIYRLEQTLVRNGINLEGEADPNNPRPKTGLSADVDSPVQTPAAVLEVSAGKLKAETPITPPVRGAMAGDMFPLEAAGVNRLRGAPIFAPAQAQGKDPRSLESQIGSQWFNRIGILAVLIGMAWFLKFAIDNHWVGPLGRVLIGLIAGAGLIAWSQWFLRKGYQVFSYSLKAVGSGTLYLALWAAFSLYHLLPSTAAFAAMIAVTAFNGYLAWAQDAELLALYAIAGGLSTPLLLSTGENHEVALFSYLLMLDLAVLVLTTLKSWSRILVTAFIGTTLFGAGWASGFYQGYERGTTTAFVLIFFLLFALAPRMVRLREENAASGWDALAVALMPMANAALGFLALLMLLEPAWGEWTGASLAVGFAAFYLALLRTPAVGMLRGSPAVLSGLHLAAAVVFLTLAIPLKTHGRWLTIGWLVEGAVLLWASVRLESKLLRGLALGCLALGLVALVVIEPGQMLTPVLNARFGAYAVGVAIFAYVALLAQREWKRSEGAEPWMSLAAGAFLIVNALILLAVSLEIHGYWSGRQWQGELTAMHVFEMDAQFSYSAWFMVFGAGLLAVGFWRRSAFVRWQALVLVAAAIAKVFLFDMSELSQGYRILSFLGLGVLLLGVSFVYQRDWLHLRGHEAEANQEEEVQP